MLKFCMPTFGNGRTTVKQRAFAFIAFHFQSIGLSRFVYVGAIFSAVTTCRGFHLTVMAPGGEVGTVAFKTVSRPFSNHATECIGIVGEGTSVCRFKSVPTSVDRFAHAR